MKGQLPRGDVRGRRGMGVVTVDPGWEAQEDRGGLPEKAPLTWAERAGALPRASRWGE